MSWAYLLTYSEAYGQLSSVLGVYAKRASAFDAARQTCRGIVARRAAGSTIIETDDGLAVVRGEGQSLYPGKVWISARARELLP